MSAPQSEYLYRITSFRHVVDLFHSQQLHFSRPSSWGDPFEVLLRHKRSNALFAQCWCKKSVSDAMWKVYSPDHASLRIRTTRSKLAELSASHSNSGMAFWIRDMDYKRPTQVRVELLKLAQRLQDSYTVAQAASALFLKRDAFEHEHEVRIVVHNERLPDTASPQQSLRLGFRAHEFVESIMFDPQVDPAFYQACSHYLRTVVGFKGSVGRSALYRLQKQLVVE